MKRIIVTEVVAGILENCDDKAKQPQSRPLLGIVIKSLG